MKSIRYAVYVILALGCLVFVSLLLFPDNVIAQDCGDCSVAAQFAGYCAGENPSKKDATDKEISINAAKINQCIETQAKAYGKSNDLFRLFKSNPDILTIYKTCGNKANDPHYVNMKKLLSCMLDKTINKITT